jgi:hypothetical protein
VTKERVLTIWRNLSFWRRLIIECSLCLVIALLFELIAYGSSADFGEASIAGLSFGLFSAVIDHAFFARPHKHLEGNDH